MTEFFGKPRVSGERDVRPARRRGALGALVTAGLVLSACGSSTHAAVGTSTVPGTTASSTTVTGATTGTTGAATTSAPAGASGSDETTGITASTIDIGELADVTGPIPGLFQGAEYGIEAWAASVNANGGIGGRKVDIKFRDSALSCTTYTNQLTSLETSTFASVGTYALFDNCGKPFLLAHPDFPDIEGYVLSSTLFPLANVYSAFPAPPGFQTTGYQYVKEQFSADLSHVGALYFASTSEPFAEQSNAAKSIGFKYVYSRGIGATETNFTSDVLRMKADGIRIVDLTDVGYADVANFLQEAQQQGLHIDAVVNTSAYDPNFITALGKTNPSSLVIPLEVAPYLDASSTVPNVQTYVHYLQITHPGAKATLYGSEAFAAGLLFQQAMATMGSNPTRSGLLASIQKITSFDGNGMIGQTNPGQKVPGVCQVMLAVKGGQFARLKPLGTGYECDGAYVDYKAS